MHLDKEYEDRLRGRDLIFPTREYFSFLYVYYQGQVLATITTENVDKEAARLNVYLSEVKGFDLSNLGAVGLPADFSKIRRELKTIGLTVEVELDSVSYHHAKE